MREPIKAYKGFGPDMKCRDFQYEEGKEYEQEGPIKACENGFHACERALDVFNYYPPCDSVYREVEQSGDISRDNADTKVASSKIKIGADIGLKGIIQAGVKFSLEKCTYSGDAITTGDRAGAQATGYQAGAQATGNRAGAQATGDQAGAQATGLNAAATAIGFESTAFADGKDAVACALGYGCKAKGTSGTLLVLLERGNWDDTAGGYPIIAVETRRVGTAGIKPDTWYMLRNGKVVEA